MRFWIILFAPVVLGIAAFGVYFYSQRSSQVGDVLTEAEREEKLARTLGREAVDGEGVPIYIGGEYKGDYFSLDYPEGVKVYDKTNPDFEKNEDLLEIFRFEGQNPRYTFTVQVSRSTVDEAENLPAVKYRKGSGLYQQISTSSSELRPAVFVRKTSPYEKSAFYYRSGFVYSFVAVSNGYEQVDEVFDEVMESVEIK